MARSPLAIVIVSVASEAGELVLNALDAGAVDFIQKPTALASERLLDMANDLVDKVRAAASARLRISDPAKTVSRLAGTVLKSRGAVDIVVLGISTGGPQALRSLIPQLPAELPVPMAIVLHMPVGYTELYARKLDEVSPLSVSRPRRRRAPRRKRHHRSRRASSTLRRNAEAGRDALDVRPLDMPHRPSVDVLFQSAADAYGGRVLGIVMTGMGEDGREGAAWIKAKGGTVFTEIGRDVRGVRDAARDCGSGAE